MKRFRLVTVFRATVKSFKTVVIPGSQNYKKKRNCYSLQKKMKFSITDFFSKCDQIRSIQRIWSHLLKKSLVENIIFCAVIHGPLNYSTFNITIQ